MKKTFLENSLQLVTPQDDTDLEQLIPLIIPAYKQVFGDEIWQEGFKCATCKRQYAFNNPAVSGRQCCGAQLNEFYSDQEVRDMLEALLVKRYQLRVILEQSELVVGFQWGWEDTLKDMNAKLDLWPQVLLDLQRRLQEMQLYGPRMYYLSENGVLPKYRCRGLSRAMDEDLRKGVRQDVRYRLLRTSPRSPQYRISQQRGDRIVLNYCDNTLDRRVMDDRVLFAGLL